MNNDINQLYKAAGFKFEAIFIREFIRGSLEGLRVEDRMPFASEESALAWARNMVRPASELDYEVNAVTIAPIFWR